MQLNRRAGRLGQDRVGHDVEILGGSGTGQSNSADLQFDVLAPSGEDLLIEQVVARIRREPPVLEVLLVQSREHADHGEPTTRGAGAFVRCIQRSAQVGLQLGDRGTAQWPRVDVDLDVELAELGLIVGIGDGVEHRRVGHRRFHVVVDEIELDLHADLRFTDVEGLIGQHDRQGIETVLHLLAKLVPVLPGELTALDVLAHGARLSVREEGPFARAQRLRLTSIAAHVRRGARTRKSPG